MKAPHFILCLAFISPGLFTVASGQEKTERDSLFSGKRLDSLIYSKKDLLGDWSHVVYLKDSKVEPVPMPNAKPSMQVMTEYRIKEKKLEGQDCAPMPNAMRVDDSLGPIIIRRLPADSLRRDSLYRKQE